MELPRRAADDVYLPDGKFTRTMERIRRFRRTAEVRVGVFNAFDYRTRMLPYWYVDKRMAPCSARTLGDCLHASGFNHTRIVLQQWAPNAKPSLAMIDDRPLDILLVSAMQVHAEPSYDLIRDAHTMGSRRPLIIAGGPKAIYEPADYFEIGLEPGVGADCVVTGEAFVLLDLLQTILSHDDGSTSVRDAFELARRSGGLNGVPGLVYLDPASQGDGPIAVNTGVQRLLRNLDEMPMPDACYRMLEPPHRGQRLRREALAVHKVARNTPIASIITTQGCKFNCSYCPIPAVNQRTWRHKSPQRLAAEMKHIYENFGIRDYFSTDDNFFNNRETVVELMSELSRTTTGGVRLGKRVRFYTEATEFDVHKNKDILPLCRRAGLRGIWFGIEDITAELVNKGQSAGKTADLFQTLLKTGIQPMAMMIHSDDQSIRAPKDDLSGLFNQARYLFKHGAISYQCTYLGPAIGTRDIEAALESKTLYRTVGNQPIPQAYFDGNHVVASKHAKPWHRQINVLRAYATFYNPLNTMRAIFRLRRDSTSANRVLFQLLGQVGILLTAPKMLAWAWRLKKGPIDVYTGFERAKIPMVHVESGEELDWAIKNLPTPQIRTGIKLPWRSVSKTSETSVPKEVSLPILTVG